VRGFLARELPAYMIPSVLVVLEALPLLPNGKLDRAALPVPVPRGEEAYEAPATAMAQALAELWAELLGVVRVGLNDSFVALGGHSLLATRLASGVRAVLGIELPVRAVFEASTLGELAERLHRDAAPNAAAALRPAARPAIVPLSFAQRR